ncbi:hypothetical protein GCM10022419_023180 [Nonomuraea rosea]|uniref:Uncharacterized protein n=1 Tax=Nonomuraea rosea TaxID=638574 RepID=A0ABP6W0X5_9ACTN
MVRCGWCEPHIVSVAGTSPYAATVDLYMPGPGDTLPVPAVKVRHETSVLLDKGNQLLRYALGKQPWLALHDLREETLVDQFQEVPAEGMGVGGQASGLTSGCVNRTGLPSDRA